MRHYKLIELSRTTLVTAALATLLWAPTGCQWILGVDELPQAPDAAPEASDGAPETPDATAADALPDPGALCEWQYSRRIIIDSSAMTGQDPLIGVPVLVHLTDQDVDHSATDPMVSALRFHALTGETLPHEVEQWNPNGDSYVWVHIPQIDPTAENVIRMSYGHPDPPPRLPEDLVWDENFAAVWHFDNDAEDSSGNGNHGTTYGAPTFHGDGPTGSALRFDGSDDYIEVGSDATLDDLRALTYSAWIDVTSFDDRQIFSKRASSRELWLKDDAGLVVRGCVAMSATNACSESDPNSLQTSVRQFVAMTFDADDDMLVRLYINGVESAYTQHTVGAGTVDADNGNPQNLGRLSSDNRYFQGSFNEVRISNVVRSDDWIAMQHQSMLGNLPTIEAESVPEACQ